jgi:ferredoxin-type protein NapH
VSQIVLRSPWMMTRAFKSKFTLPLAVFAFVSLMLSIVQLKMKMPMMILERFIPGAGWFEIGGISFYAAFVAYKMQDPLNVPRWRRITWITFSTVFFAQLILGLSGLEKFLMTGKLHLPIPMMILGGPLYRGQTSVMTFLFLSTIILSGPAWCSQLCYFGAFDSLASRGKTQRGALKNKISIKSTILLLIIVAVILLRWFNVPVFWATLLAVAFGFGGIGVMIFISRKQGRMIHCVMYCPIGTIVNIFRYANPFRMYIDSNCSLCMKCTSFCKYDALNPQDIKNKKPSFSCTLCGDCLAACRDNSIKYKYLKLSPAASRNLYLFFTISLHAVFMAVARI